MSTQSGKWWVARLAGVLILGVVLRAELASGGSRRLRWPLISVVAAVLLATALGGHAATGRSETLAVAATTLHLAAVSIWLGGLALLSVTSRMERRDMAARFARWGLVSVAVLVSTGSIAALRQMDTVASLLDTSYGRWLSAKLIVVIVVVALAASVRRDIRSRSPVAAPPSRRLRAELAGIGVAMVATVGLVASVPPGAVTVDNRSVTAFQGDRFAQIDLEPAVTGPTTMHVTLISPRGSLDRADEITVAAELPAADLGPIEIAVAIAGANHVTTNQANLPVAGRWRFVVTARYGEFDEVVFTGELDVDER